LQSDIARFNFQQNQPQQNLSSFLSTVYGNPMANLRSTTVTGGGPSTLQNVLGTAATLGGLYKNLGGSAGIGNLYNSGSNWLSGFSGGGGGGGFVDVGGEGAAILDVLREYGI
jgi:hypothetical protein